MADPCVQLAQKLASNDKKSRDRALRKLRTYLKARSGLPEGGFSLEELCKVWKGLFYCLWMQDKPLLQEELARSMAQLVHVLQSKESRNLFLRAFWQTLNREWNGIDRLRLDKFYSLMRFVLHQSAELLRRAEWEQRAVEEFLALLVEEVLKPEASHGVQHHLMDIYLEELAKVGSAQLSADINLKLIDPFCKIVANTKDLILKQSVVNGIFHAILDQAPYAIEDLMKEIGHTPTDDDSINDRDAELARILDSEDIGPVLQFDYQAISERLFGLASHRDVPARNRKSLYYLVKRFKDLAEGMVRQEGFPEEVSTDEDDDEFSSWRFRKRAKKFRERLLASHGIAPEPKTTGKRPRRPAASNEPAADGAEVPPAKKRKKKKKKTRSVPAHKEKHQSQHNGISETPPTSEDISIAAAPSAVLRSERVSGLSVRRRRSRLIRLGLSVLPLRRASLCRRKLALGRRRQLTSNIAASPPVTPPPLHVTPPPLHVTPPPPPATTPPAKTSAKQDFITFQKSAAPRALYVKGSKTRGRQVITNHNSNSKKVTFSLKKNMTAEFRRTDRSLLVSPSGSSRVAFNPSQRPRHSALKTPSPVTRARASDFF